MKYAGGPVMAVSFIIFSSIAVLMITEDILMKDPLPYTFLLFISIPMAIFSVKGSYYCFKYAGLFTKRFTFSPEGIYVSEPREKHPNSAPMSIDRVVYFRLLKTFLIESRVPYSRSIIVMNNGANETEAFLKVKEFLLSQSCAITKWI